MKQNRRSFFSRLAGAMAAAVGISLPKPKRYTVGPKRVVGSNWVVYRVNWKVTDGIPKLGDPYLWESYNVKRYTVTQQPGDRTTWSAEIEYEPV